ncbi:MAG: mobile mystery protein A [Methylococcaceae bacterium]
MGIDSVVAKQYRAKVNQAYTSFGEFSMSPNGWLRMVRNALGMTGAQLAKRLGVTKARISKAEQDELTGSVTLKTMQNMAAAMNCRFVYAVVPDNKVEEIIKKRAYQKASEQIKSASTQMALEAQSLNDKQLEFAVDELASEIVKKMPSDLWNDE